MTSLPKRFPNRADISTARAETEALEPGQDGENKLSNESPVGRAIMGRKKGETVEVVAPRGTLKFKIMAIKAA